MYDRVKPAVNWDGVAYLQVQCLRSSDAVRVQLQVDTRVLGRSWAYRLRNKILRGITAKGLRADIQRGGKSLLVRADVSQDVLFDAVIDVAAEIKPVEHGLTIRRTQNGYSSRRFQIYNRRGRSLTDEMVAELLAAVKAEFANSSLRVSGGLTRTGAYIQFDAAYNGAYISFGDARLRRVISWCLDEVVSSVRA